MTKENFGPQHRRIKHTQDMKLRSLHQQLAGALRDRLAVIANRELRERDPAAHLEALKTASEKITQLQAQLPRDTDPQLRHFLKKCSYEKALAMLETTRMT